jgi:hypothetical protein
MAKRKNINGIPNNLIQQYFSTLFYWNGGYMADWIWSASTEKNISEIEIDILKKTVSPNTIEIKQITTYLDRLKTTISKELTNNGFEEDFIVSAKFDIFISSTFKTQKLLTCIATLIDKEQRIYKSKTYTEKSYEETLTVFKKSLTTQIRNWIKQKLKI